MNFVPPGTGCTRCARVNPNRLGRAKRSQNPFYRLLSPVTRSREPSNACPLIFAIVKMSGYEYRRQLIDLDMQMTASQGRLLDILARISNCLDPIRSRFSATYYLDLKREYTRELEVLAGLKREKAKLQKQALTAKSHEERQILPIDRRFLSTQ